MSHNFEHLEVWKRTTDLAVRIYKEIHELKDYTIRDQMLRSAVSIPSNIAEGSERSSEKEFRYFLRVAKGSAAELRTQLYITTKADLIDQSFYQEMRLELIEISKMLFGLINHIKNSNDKQ